MYYYSPLNGTYIHTDLRFASSANDGHGGHAAEHAQMMECIANEVVDKKITELLKTVEQDAYAAAYAHMIKDLSFDVQTAVNLALDDVGKITLDTRTRNVIATNLMNEIRTQIEGLNFKK